MKNIKKSSKKIRKSLFITLISISLMMVFVFKANALDVSAKSAILICADSGLVIWGKNENEPMPMASTTKIMTSILTLENLEATGNKEVEITPEMIRVEGTSMGLAQGDIVNLESLAEGMLLCSGNDAANAAAIAVGGDIEKFIDLMNEKAHQLGMKNTKFVTPSGLDKDNHHSTAYDMAILGAYAMENELFSKIVSRKSMTVKFINPSKTVKYRNHNKLLRLYPYCIGIKTGFTKLAGRCLVSCAEKDGVRLVCVTLNAPSDWNDHICLYNYGFENVISKTFDDKNFTSQIKVINGEKEKVNAGVLENFSASFKPDQEPLISKEIKIPESIKAPVQKGQILGKIVYFIDNKVIGENNIVSLEEVKEIKPQKSGIFSNIAKFFSSLFKSKKGE